MKTLRIGDDVLAILSGLKIEGNVVKRIERQLERNLYTAVDKALVALGGKWNRSANGHLFAEDPTEKIDAAILTGAVVDTKKTFDFFETPDLVAKQVVDLAKIGPGMAVLEPSAGKGNIANWVYQLHPDVSDVTCVEIQRENFDELRRQELPAILGDFLKMDVDPVYDRVVMNPPFSKQQDIDHVKQAFEFLVPGGRLVAVMAAGVKFRENRKTKAFRDFVESHNGEIEDLPEGSFKESGTGVNTVVVVLNR